MNALCYLFVLSTLMITTVYADDSNIIRTIGISDCVTNCFIQSLASDAGLDISDPVKELTVTINDYAISDRTLVELGFNMPQVNYEISAVQNGKVIYAETAHAVQYVATHQINAVGSDQNPIDIGIVSLGIGPPESSEDWTGPTGLLTASHVIPEFGTIAMLIMAVALVGIIAVTVRSRLASNNAGIDGNKATMSKSIYKFAMLVILAIIVFGIYMAISGYNTDIYPLDRIRGNLDAVVSSSDPDTIRDHLVAIQADLNTVMANLPEITDAGGQVVSKNPVWLFATESTNFLRIQNNIDTMFAGVNEISSISKDNSAYHTGMLDINDRALLLKINIMDATPYMYVSPANMAFSVIWLAAIIGILALLKRKREHLQKADEIGI